MSRKRHKKGKRPIKLSPAQQQQPTSDKPEDAKANPPPLGVSVAEDVGTSDKLG